MPLEPLPGVLLVSERSFILRVGGGGIWIELRASCLLGRHTNTGAIQTAQRRAF
jgi:hypothetical protein